jgi:hypothetical protein
MISLIAWSAFACRSHGQPLIQDKTLKYILQKKKFEVLLQILGIFLQKMGKKLSTFIGDSTYTRAPPTHRSPLRSNN